MTTIDVYLGIDEGALLHDGAAAAWSSHAGLDAGLDALFRSAAALAPGRWRRPPVRLWLSGALARPFVCGPVDGLKRWREALAVAEASAAEATGIAPPCAVTLEGWPSPHAVLAVATGAATIAAIEAASAAHGIALRSIRPWWAAAVNEARKSDPAAPLIAVTDGDALTLLGWQGEHLHTANAYLPAPSAEQSDRLLARLALTAGVASEAVRRIALSRAALATSSALPFGEPAGSAA